MQAILLARAGAILRYHDLPGDGPPLVLLHGLGCASSSDFPRVCAEPPLAARRRILVDLLGSGYSDRPSAFAYDVASHAAVVLELLEALQLGPVDLFGHSMGGSIAIACASARPEGIASLVTAEPNLDPGGGMFSRRIAQWTEEEYAPRGHAVMVRGAAASGNHVWAGTMAVSFARGVHRAASSLVRGSSPTWRQMLERLEIPRTVVFGEHSLPDADVDRLRAHGVRTMVVPGAGHSMMWENPAGLARAIAEGLA